MTASPTQEIWLPDEQNFDREVAATFPNTATVESDFSVLKREKNCPRTDLKDLSFEGTLQCKEHGSEKFRVQWREIKANKNVFFEFTRFYLQDAMKKAWKN